MIKIKSKRNLFLETARLEADRFTSVGADPGTIYHASLDAACAAARECQDDKCRPAWRVGIENEHHTDECLEIGADAADAVRVLERLVALSEIALAEEEQDEEERRAAEAERMFALYQGDARREPIVDQSLAYDKSDPKRLTALGWEG